MKKLKRAFERLHKNGIRLTVKHYLKRFGFRTTLFYYTKETMPPEFSAGQYNDEVSENLNFKANSSVLTLPVSLPEGFKFSTFNLSDVLEISRMPERNDYVYQNYVIDNFQKGDICLGFKYQGEIVAFTWFNLSNCHSPLYHSVMKPTEAYLYDMYVLKKMRGRKLAPLLRYKCYEALRAMDRDIFYSITEKSNTASLKFKRKLGAEHVFLGLYIELFSKFRKTWVLKWYPGHI